MAVKDISPAMMILAVFSLSYLIPKPIKTTARTSRKFSNPSANRDSELRKPIKTFRRLRTNKNIKDLINTPRLFNILLKPLSCSFNVFSQIKTCFFPF